MTGIVVMITVITTVLVEVFILVVGFWEIHVIALTLALWIAFATGFTGVSKVSIIRTTDSRIVTY